jgi:hypothetical protein
MAVILLGLAVQNFFDPRIVKENKPVVTEEQTDNSIKHPLSGEILAEEADFFAIAVMIDNAYDVRPQYGLAEADIIYEALAESHITRLIAIFDSQKDIDKIGPVRSARNYYMDWVEEYNGVYMHVGGSPQALSVIDDYDFVNIDQIGSGEIYFWRDNNFDAPHNVFTSDSNWLRVGEMKEPNKVKQSIAWNFVDVPAEALEETPERIDFIVNFGSETYRVDWKFNDKIDAYQRWQGGEKFLHSTGEQAKVDNVIVQVVDSHLIDEERRGMDTQKGGKVFVLNVFGLQQGEWKVEDGRTRFYDANNEEIKLVSGKTWVEIINDEDGLIMIRE